MASQGLWLISLLVIVSHGACDNKTLGEQLCDAVMGENYTEGSTALIRAAHKDNVRISEALLEHGANLEARGTHGWTALHSAAYSGNMRVLEALLEHGANPEARDEDGATALHFAAHSGSVGVSEALLEYRADLEARDEDGATALHQAAFYGNVGVSEALLEHGADPEARDKHGWTALHFTARNGNLATVKLLVNKGADPLATDNEMETPIDIAMREHKMDMADWLRTNGGATPTPTSWESWQHVLRFQPREVAACVGAGVLLAGFKTTLEWTNSDRAIATQDPSPALVGELLPSTGALRLAAKAITKDHRCGSLLEPMKLLANSLAVLASLLVVCGPCMWVVKPIYVAMVAGPAFLVPVLWTFGWREVVNFPVLVIAVKTTAARCRAAVTSLLLVVVVLYIWYHDYQNLRHDVQKYLHDTNLRNPKLRSCFNYNGCSLRGSYPSLSFSVGGLAWEGEIRWLDMMGVQDMMGVHLLLSLLLILATLLWVLGVAVTTPRCCRLPVTSRSAVEQLAREIDGAGAASELPRLHPKLQPEGLSGLVMKTGFAMLDIFTDLNTIATFIVTSNFWFAGILWTAFLASLGSELVKGNIQALPRELKRTLETGVMTDRLIDFLDTDKGFEAPFSLAITIYAMPFVARNMNIFLTQCFSLFTSTLGIAGFLTTYLTQATLSDEPDVGEPTTVPSEGYTTLPTATAGGQEEQRP